jgi:hypothetical protein
VLEHREVAELVEDLGHDACGAQLGVGGQAVEGGVGPRDGHDARLAALAGEAEDEREERHRDVVPRHPDEQARAPRAQLLQRLEEGTGVELVAVGDAPGLERGRRQDVDRQLDEPRQPSGERLQRPRRELGDRLEVDRLGEERGPTRHAPQPPLPGFFRSYFLILL